MLTNVHYYGHYKPYIFKDNRIKEFFNAKNTHTIDGYNVLLNKSLKNEVIKYVNLMSESIVNIKESINLIINHITDFYSNQNKYTKEQITNWLQAELNIFVEEVNISLDLFKEQPHSKKLKEFANNFESTLEENLEYLNNIGILKEESSNFKFNENTISKIDFDSDLDNLKTFLPIFQELYNDTVNLLKLPFNEHMQFKYLNYYYNYQMGKIKQNTFNIVQQGLIIDITI